MTYAQNASRVVPFPEIVRSVSPIFKQRKLINTLKLTSGCRIKRYTFTSINISRKQMLDFASQITDFKTAFDTLRHCCADRIKSYRQIHDVKT